MRHKNKEENMSNIMKRTNGNGSSHMPAATFSNVVDKIFQDNLSRFFDDDFWGFKGLNRSTNVPVNLRETDKSYELEVVAPGLKKEDFKINISGDTLIVSFEHKKEDNQENQKEGWLRKEYKMQSFSRSFNLDDSIDANNIAAKYDNGILCLSLPKKEEIQKVTRTIEIQ
jgi:HSP20 family protein